MNAIPTCCCMPLALLALPAAAQQLALLDRVPIVDAQIDPFRSDGETLAEAMRRAGDRVEQRALSGVTHEFFGMGTIGRGAYDANMYAVQRLKAAFAR